MTRDLAAMRAACEAGYVSTADYVKGRQCTCHPDDNPPRPCPQKFAYSECAACAHDWKYSLPTPESAERRTCTKCGLTEQLVQHWEKV